LNELETAGLPQSIILAVTGSHLHALEDNHHGDDLVAGRVLKSWDRAGVKARHAVDNFYAGVVPDDRQVLILHLPTEFDRIRYLPPAARKTAQVRGGMPHQFIFARDAPSQRLIDALGATGPLIITGHYSQGMNAQAAPRAAVGAPAFKPPQPSAAQRLQELETLRATGAISEAEYARKREQIISEL
jgi:hypothetical protein